MKKTYEDLTNDEKKEYIIIRELQNHSAFLCGILFIGLSVISSFNSKGEFLYRTALVDSYVFIVVTLGMMFYDKHKTRKLFGLN